MLHSIFTKTLRGYWIAILGWGGGLGLVVYATLAAYATQLSTPLQRQEFAILANTFRFLAEPVAVTTATGFITWRSFAILPLLLGVWAILAGSRLIRGAEERGALDLVLATPRSRARYLAEGVAALTVALVLIGLLIGLGALGGEAATGEPVAPGGALLAGLNVALLALFFALLALLLSQFVTRAGTAAGAAGGLLVLAWALDGAGRVVPGGAWLGWLSPYHLYSLSKPLIAERGAHPAALLGLVALTVACGAASAPLFARRDLGGVAWAPIAAARRPQADAALDNAARTTWLRGIGPLTLHATLPSVAWWTVGLALLTLFIVGIVRATKDSLSNLLGDAPVFAEIIAKDGLATDAAFLSGLLFFFLPLLLALYALALAIGWARDLDAGRFELVLSTPTPRRRIFLDSWGATLIGLVIVPLTLWLVILSGGRIWSLTLSGGQLLAAFVGLLALELLVAAFAYLVGGRLGASATLGIGGGLLVLSFVLNLIGPLLDLPAPVLGLSIFYQYGSPLTTDPRWAAWAIMVALAATLLALALARFTRADLQRGT